MIRNVADLEGIIQSCLDDTNFVLEYWNVDEYFDRGGAGGDLVEVLRSKVNCAVCMEIPVEGCVTSCKHIFCLYCIHTWFIMNMNGNCPMCRSPCTESPRSLPTLDGVVSEVLHGRDLNGRVALVTGANTGIGFETARSLAKHGCSVIFACRSLTSADEAITKIREEKASAADNCTALYVDLCSLESVTNLVHNIKSRHKRLDMLILNAGLFGLPYTKTADGYEAIFQVNHLAQFYLTLLLRPLLVTGSRVVIVSSESHRFANLTLDNMTPLALSPESAKKYWDMTAYNNSKLCNVLFARQLAKLLQNSGISVFSLHPGNLVSSSLSRNWWLYRLFFAIVRPFTKSLQQAASTTVYCATALELTGVTGVYFNNCFRCEESATAKDDELAKALWDVSLDMIRTATGNATFDMAESLNHGE